MVEQICGHISGFLSALDVLHRPNQQPQKVCATIGALYQCFKKCTQCVVIENQHSNYCKVTKKKIGNGNHVFIVVSWEYDNNCAKKCAFTTILGNRI